MKRLEKNGLMPLATIWVHVNEKTIFFLEIVKVPLTGDGAPLNAETATHLFIIDVIRLSIRLWVQRLECIVLKSDSETVLKISILYICNDATEIQSVNCSDICGIFVLHFLD